MFEVTISVALSYTAVSVVRGLAAPVRLVARDQHEAPDVLLLRVRSKVMGRRIASGGAPRA